MQIDQIKKRVAAEGVDTVILCFPDLQGRLVGKRETAEYFLGYAGSGSNMCDYLFTVDVEGQPIPGFKSASWEKGYGDFTVIPDFATWRKAPWLPSSAIVLGTPTDKDGRPVPTAPRAVLEAQVAAGKAAGYSFNFASELEFYAYKDSYDEVIAKDFRDLVPTSPYSQDYNLLRTTSVEPFLHDVRKSMEAMGIHVETVKGEWGAGQQEISLRYGDPVGNADNHVYYKHAVKELAAGHGQSVTFMAKPASDAAGSSCHIHASLWSADGTESRSVDTGSADGLSAEFRHFMAGVLRHADEATLFFAPTVNSYKRFQSGSFAPTRICWGRDNRTTGFRLVGSGKSTRMEVRIPGADANPYTAFAAMIAAGLRGIRDELPLEQECTGNAYANPANRSIPVSIGDAIRLLDGSALYREALGDDVVDHYVHAAHWELSQYEACVTDWEKRRLFERI